MWRFILLWLYYDFFVVLFELFTHMLQGYFTGTRAILGAIVGLPQCQWNNPEGYG